MLKKVLKSSKKERFQEKQSSTHQHQTWQKKRKLIKKGVAIDPT